jgi:hypothetical protein
VLQVEQEEAEEVYAQVVKQRGEAATPRVNFRWSLQSATHHNNGGGGGGDEGGDDGHGDGDDFSD